MSFLKCEHTKCQRFARYLCRVCEKAVCAEHAVALGEDEALCHRHAGAAQAAAAPRVIPTSMQAVLF